MRLGGEARGVGLPIRLLHFPGMQARATRSSGKKRPIWPFPLNLAQDCFMVCVGQETNAAQATKRANFALPGPGWAGYRQPNRPLVYRHCATIGLCYMYASYNLEALSLRYIVTRGLLCCRPGTWLWPRARCSIATGCWRGGRRGGCQAL